MGAWALVGLLTMAAGAEPARNAWYREALANIHVDNHSGLVGKEQGAEALGAMFEGMPCAMIQVSAQSNGPATYPTEVGLNHPAGGYDTLATFRQVADRNRMRLGVYMSVDRRPLQLKEHPEWAARNAAGEIEVAGEPIVCQRPNAAGRGYLYEQFLPQIREIAGRYDPAGFWFDGDYILTRPCWCERCLAEWRRETGAAAPRDAAAPEWSRWLTWHRARYEEYRRLVAEAIHQASPRALYTSNWSWAWNAEPVPDYVDTLSGDAWSIKQVHSVTQRWGSQQRVPWDVMSYCNPSARAFRREYSLQRTWQEGALTIARGGVWFLWAFGGRITPSGVDLTRQAANWVKDRAGALGPSGSLASVAVLDSETAWRAGGESGVDSRAHLLARNLDEQGYFTDLVNEDDLARHAGYQVIVLPEARVVAPETLARLRELVERGGLLLATGGALAGHAEAAELLGIRRTEPAAGAAPARIELGQEPLYAGGMWTGEPTAAEVLVAAGDRPLVTVRKLGRGQVAWLATSALPYPDDGLIGGLLRKLGYGPSYRATGPAGAALLCTLRGRGRQTVLHVIDLSARVNGVAADVDTGEYTDFNPTLENVRVTLPYPAARATGLPTGTVVTTEVRDDRLIITLDTLQTHAAVLLDLPPQPVGFLPAETPSGAGFHPPVSLGGTVFSDGFESVAPGATPARPWAPEVRGATAIRAVDEPGRGRVLELLDTPDSSFWPFLHRSVPPFRKGRAKLSYDLRVAPGAHCLTEVRYEGKGPGPSFSVNGEGLVQAGGKRLTQLAPNLWCRYEVVFELGGERPAYTLSIKPAGQPAQVFEQLPYASDWFVRCDSVYFVGSGQQAGSFYLDNVQFEHLPPEE